MGLLNYCASVKAYPASKKGNHLCDSNARLAKYLAALPAKLRRYLWAAALVRTQPPTKERKECTVLSNWPARCRREVGAPVVRFPLLTLCHRTNEQNEQH